MPAARAARVVDACVHCRKVPGAVGAGPARARWFTSTKDRRTKPRCRATCVRGCCGCVAARLHRSDIARMQSARARPTGHAGKGRVCTARSTGSDVAFTGRIAAFPGADAAFTGRNAAFPDADAAFTGRSAAFPGADGAFTGRNGAFPGADGAFTGRRAAFPGADAAFTGGIAAFPGADRAIAGSNTAIPGANIAALARSAAATAQLTAMQDLQRGFEGDFMGLHPAFHDTFQGH